MYKEHRVNFPKQAIFLEVREKPLTHVYLVEMELNYNSLDERPYRSEEFKGMEYFFKAKYQQSHTLTIEPTIFENKKLLMVSVFFE